MKQRAIYVNMTRRMVLLDPPLTSSRPITFSDADTHVILFPHNDALVVTMHIGNCRVSKIPIDVGSSVNILYGAPLTGWRKPGDGPCHDQLANQVSSVRVSW